MKKKLKVEMGEQKLKTYDFLIWKLTEKEKENTNKRVFLVSLFFILYVILFCFIHEIGHIIGFLITNAELIEVQINPMYISIIYYDVLIPLEKLVVISALDSIISVLFWIVISIVKKNYLTCLLMFVTILIESLQWCLGAFLYSSDIKTFSRALEINPLVVMLILLPFLTLSIYFSYIRLKKYD